MSKTALKLYRSAIDMDPSIACTKGSMTLHKGNTEAYLSSLGLHKNHLKVLSRTGHAIRAYTKNIWLPGEEMPNGKTVEDKSTYRDNGHKRVWLIIKEET